VATARRRAPWRLPKKSVKAWAKSFVLGFPQLDLVAFRVQDPGELAIGIILPIAHDSLASSRMVFNSSTKLGTR
jgi:hypothetical protein